MVKFSPQIRCTLLIPDPSKEGVWGCIPSVATDDKSVFVNLTEKGIRLSFPRDTDRSVSDLEMTASTLHHITIELLGSSTNVRELTDNEAKAFESYVSRDKTEGFRVLTLTPTTDKACGPRVNGFGTSFHGVNATVDGYVNQETQICGVASLSEILRRKDFTILVEETRLAPYLPYLKAHRKPETFGYGEVHKWDISQYRKQVPNLRGIAFSPRVRFENANERDTALTQMHVQDVWDFNDVLEDVAEMEVGEEPAEKTTQFVCLLEPDKIFRPHHWRAARRALHGDASKLEVTFKPSKDVPWSVSWEASHLTFASSDHLRGVDLKRRLPLLLKRLEDNSRSHKFCPFSYPKYEGTGDDLKRSTVVFHCHLNLHSESLRVFAINHLSSPKISPSTMEADPRASSKQAIFNELLIGQGLWSLQKQGVNVELPSFDIFDGIPVDVRDACLKHVFENDKERVRRYFGKLHLGLGLVSGPPGTGKSHLASIVVILMCLNKSIKHVYVAAASNGATDNIVERIDGMAQTIIGTLLGSDVKHLMLLRGYSLGIEVENCTMALLNIPFKEDAIWNPSPWKFSRSLCWWTLRVLGSKRVPRLSADDNIELWNLQQRLNALVEPSSTPNDPELLKFRQLLKVAKGFESPVAYKSIVTK
ncbi:unnamed protein product [Fusarium graminearum]|uniref:DNA2/NAM7 helicase helicase domain-containing protein n=1 Tax=Gibberella zeae TaxID=5518 RepID=A0A9N8WRL8_GIBZA|nr:unnamed protein product [Fusarium graminearum]